MRVSFRTLEVMLSEYRSGRLVAWGNAWLAGHASLDEAAEAVCLCDEPHRVFDVPAEAGPVSLTVALGRLRAAGVTGLQLALPRPGDALGLTGPPEFNVLATEAGEAVVGLGAPYGLVPAIHSYGPAGDRGHQVTWQVLPVAGERTAALPTLSEADRELADALREVTAELLRLDVARWRPEAAAALQAIREHGRDGTAVLAPGYPARAVRVLTLAQRLSAIAELAQVDDGGAVSSSQATVRAELLRDLERRTRRAQVAACQAILEPAHE
jgi:hypothetical protein